MAKKASKKKDAIKPAVEKIEVKPEVKAEVKEPETTATQVQVSNVFDTFTNANEPPREEEKQENPFLKEEPAEASYTNEPYYGDAPASEPAPVGEESLPWAEVFAELMKINMPLWGVLHDSEACISGDFVLIKSNNPTLNAFIRGAGNSRDVKQAIFRVTGRKFRLGLNSPKGDAAASSTQQRRDPLEDLISQAKAMDINVDIKP